MKGLTLLNNRKARITTLVATGAAAAAAAGVGTAGQANADAGVWDRVAQCESGGNWGTSTGNGFHGGLQFTPSTWAAYGGQGSAHNASKAEQIRVAQRVLAGQGPGAWPVCSKRAGLTASNGGSASSVDSDSSERASRSAERPAADNDRVERKVERKVEDTDRKVERKVVRDNDDERVERKVVRDRDNDERASRSVERKPVLKQDVTPKRHVNVAPKAELSGDKVVVKAGDTLGKIAKANDVNWRALYAANSAKIDNPNLIFVGQVLNLPA